jgi:hypothetical protein
VLFLQVLLELVKGMIRLSNTEPTVPLGPMELELMLKPITTVRKQLDIAFLEGADVGPKVSEYMFSDGVVSPVLENLNQSTSNGESSVKTLTFIQVKYFINKMMTGRS